MANKQSSNTSFPLLAKVINGTIAGIVGVTSIFPLDLVKTRLQNQRIGPNGEKLYTSMLDCFRKVYRAEGLLGMYRGVGITVAMSAPEKMVKLTANDIFRYNLTAEDGSLPISRQMLAGALTGLVQMFITSPLELVKINMQIAALQKSQGVKPATGRNFILNVLREKGITGIYKGLGPTAARDVPFSMLYFPLFATLYELGPRNPDGSIPSWCSLLAGLSSGSFSALAVTPMDVLKTRIQASVKQTDKSKTCNGMLDCALNTYKNEGITAFFKGGLCRMMVIAPLFGIAQLFYLLGIGEKILEFF